MPLVTISTDSILISSNFA